MRKQTYVIGIAASLLVLGACEIEQTEEARLPDIDVTVRDEGRLPQFEIEQTREGRLPDIDIDVRGGNLPEFDVDVQTPEEDGPAADDPD